MNLRTLLVSACISLLFLGSLATAAAQYQGWDITTERKAEKSPLASSPDVVAKGKALDGAVQVSLARSRFQYREP